MSRQTDWQHRQREIGCCIDCGNGADRRADGTHYARCSECRERQRTSRRRLVRWECPYHPGRKALRSRIRPGELYCGVRLMDGDRCQMSSTDETPEEARARLDVQGSPWRCPDHPDAIPRQANTPGHYYCAVRKYGGDEINGYYCGNSSAAETREQQSTARLEQYRAKYGRLPWEGDPETETTCDE